MIGAFAWIVLEWEPEDAVPPLGAGPGNSDCTVGFDFRFASDRLYGFGHGNRGWSDGHRGF